MPGPNGEHPQGGPEIERGPVTMAVDLMRVTFNGQPWLIFRFRTAQGEDEFWLEAPVAHAFGRKVLQMAGGIVVPGPGEAPGGLRG